MAQPVAGKAKHTAHIDTMCYRYSPSDTVTAFILQLRMLIIQNAADRINGVRPFSTRTCFITISKKHIVPMAYMENRTLPETVRKASYRNITTW